MKGLEDVEKEKIKAAAAKRKTFIKIYNNLCIKCRAMVARNPGVSFDKYCSECQDMMESVWE